MALSGSKSIDATNHDVLKFSWTATQSIDDNTSTISWKMELISEDYGQITSSVSKDWKVVVNGVSYSGTNKIGIDDNKTLKLASGTTKITHDADGTKTFSYSFSQEFNITWGDTKIGTKTGSGTGTLDTIPRATTPTVSATSVDMGGTITVSMPRASSSFTHTLKYAIGSATGTVASSLGTSYTWTVPLTLAQQIPSATSGIVTLTCYTYKGSTLVGSKTVKFTAKVPTSVVPTISSVTITDTNSTQYSKIGGFVKNKSAVKVVVSATGAQGSTISNYSTVVGGATYTGASFTVNKLTTSGSLDFKVTVKDTRGRTATTTKTITVLDYSNPVISTLTAIRVNSDGTTNDEGAYTKISYAFNISTLNNKNNKSYKLEFKLSSSTTYTTLSSSELYTANTSLMVGANKDDSYTVRLTISDYFTSVSRTVEVPTAFTLLDFHSGGKGLAIGKVAEGAGFECDLATTFNKNVTFEGGVTFPGWTTVTDLPTVVTDPAVATKGVRYRKIGNQVFLSGRIGLTADYAGGAVLIFTLPSGYRPTHNTYRFSACSGARITRLFVQSGGAVRIEWIYDMGTSAVVSGAISWVDLDCDFFTD